MFSSISYKYIVNFNNINIFTFIAFVLHISANTKVKTKTNAFYRQSFGRTISSANMAALPKPPSTPTTQDLVLAGGWVGVIPSNNFAHSANVDKNLFSTEHLTQSKIVLDRC